MIFKESTSFPIEAVADSKPLIFQNCTELDTWVKRETEAYSSLSASTGINELRAFNAMQNTVLSRIGAFAKKIRDIESEGASEENSGNNSPDFESLLLSLIQQLKSDQQSFPFMESTSASAATIREIKANFGAQAAGAAIAYMKNIPFNMNHSDQIKGIIELAKFGTELPPSAASLQTNLDDWKTQYSEQIKRHAKFVIKYKEQLKSIAESTLQVNSSEKARENEFNEFIDNKKADYSALRDTFEKYMEIHSASEYWKLKAKSHRNRMWLLIVAIGVVASSTIFGVFQIAVIKLDKPLTETPLSQLIIPLVFTSILIWLIRVLVKICLSQIHLISDAEERVVMIKTYLSMNRSSSLKPEDRNYILSTVFRPANQGIIKDDGPQSAMNELSALLKVTK
jgi:hypothetical protein